MQNVLLRMTILVFLSFAGSVFADSTTTIANFQAIDSDGKKFDLYSHKSAKAIVIVAHSNDCPIVRQTYPRFKEVAEQFKKDSVEIFYVNPNIQDDVAGIKKTLSEFAPGISVLL